MAMAANLVGIVHHAAIVRRVVVRVLAVAVLVAVVKVAPVKVEGGQKAAVDTKAGRVAAVADDRSKGSPKSNWKS